MGDDPTGSLALRLKIVFFILCSSAVDCILLVGWAALQWGGSYLLSKMTLDAMDSGVLLLMRILLAALTLWPVALWVISDIEESYRSFQYMRYIARERREARRAVRAPQQQAPPLHAVGADTHGA